MLEEGFSYHPLQMKESIALIAVNILKECKVDNNNQMLHQCLSLTNLQMPNQVKLYHP